MSLKWFCSSQPGEILWVQPFSCTCSNAQIQCPPLLSSHMLIHRFTQFQLTCLTQYKDSALQNLKLVRHKKWTCVQLLYDHLLALQTYYFTLSAFQHHLILLCCIFTFWMADTLVFLRYTFSRGKATMASNKIVTVQCQFHFKAT